MVTLDSLIRKGYFPEELTPMFSTEKLADTLVAIDEVLNSISKNKTAIASKHTIPRVKHLRRTLSIPNPLLQIRLCKTIEDNWTNIEDFLSGDFSLTKPVVREESNRAVIRLYNYPYIFVQQAKSSTCSRFVLRTDISRFYPTIYTHSIPWAIHSKALAKINRKDELYGNLLDKRIRNSMDGQTIGIPIGPDSSLIVAEIIATAIDKKLKEILGEIKGFRYMDDYYFYFHTYSEAEYTLNILNNLMKDFELELNPTKTYIEELPQPLEFRWVSELRNFRIRENVKGQHTDLIGYFSRAFEYTKRCPNEHVLKYALARITDIEIKIDNWPLYESLILNSIIAEPSVIPVATQILYKRQAEGHTLNKVLIADTINQIITNSVQLNYDNEIAWGLWLCKMLNIVISETVAREISNSNDNIVALAALDLQDSGLITAGLDIIKWKTLLRSSELYTENWLLAYEANIKGWLLPDRRNDYISNDPFFNVLKNNNVEFYQGISSLVPDLTDAEDIEDEPDYEHESDRYDGAYDY